MEIHPKGGCIGWHESRAEPPLRGEASGEGGRQPEVHERGCGASLHPDVRLSAAGSCAPSTSRGQTTGMGERAGEEGVLAFGQRARPGVMGGCSEVSSETRPACSPLRGI